MRRLPDDFNVNILLPGAVWLLISVLAGRVAVARLETDAITVVMFVVISLVIFIVPMAVYMEYRKKIEQLSERKSKKASSPSGSGSSGKSQSTTEPETACRFSFPPDFPDALKGDRTMIFMEALRHEGFLDAEYRPHDGCNATLMAFNMRQLLDVKNRRGSKADKEDVIISIFKKVAEADDNIRNTDAYRSWERNIKI